MVATITSVRGSSSNNNRHRSRGLGLSSSIVLLLTLTALVMFWGVGFLLITWNLHLENGREQANRPSLSVIERPLTPRLLSRNTTLIKSVTADVRGNLGPAEVVVKKGDDWLKDRWQAASNMHGKNIPGQHWIVLEFTEPIVVSKIVLDWETAYCNEYVVEGSLEAMGETENESDPPQHKVLTLFDGRDSKYQAIRTEQKHGQSPGVKQKMPLHIVHTIPVAPQSSPVKFLRLQILKSVTGWGVSLWQWDVYGLLERDLIM